MLTFLIQSVSLSNCKWKIRWWLWETAKCLLKQMERTLKLTLKCTLVRQFLHHWRLCQLNDGCTLIDFQSIHSFVFMKVVSCCRFSSNWAVVIEMSMHLGGRGHAEALFYSHMKVQWLIGNLNSDSLYLFTLTSSLSNWQTFLWVTISFCYHPNLEALLRV